MSKACIKCGRFMVYEDQTYTCEYCLAELIKVKREIWESQSKELVREVEYEGVEALLIDIKGK